MSIVDIAIRTITCNGPNCTRTVTFEQSQAEQIVRDNPWLNSIRVIQVTGSKRNLSYCSDTCEVDGITSGAHNPVEEKPALITSANEASIRQAAQLAAQAEAATKAIKAGSGISLS